MSADDKKTSPAPKNGAVEKKRYGGVADDELAVALDEC